MKVGNFEPSLSSVNPLQNERQVSIYLYQRPVYVIGSSQEFIQIIIAEAARCLDISSEEFIRIAPPIILNRINKIFSEVSFDHKLNQLFKKFSPKKNIVEFDLSLKLNSVIYSLTNRITQELSSVNICSYQQLVYKLIYLSKLKREAENVYLRDPINYALRRKVELSLWDFNLISSFDLQIISHFFNELKENHNIEAFISLKENTKTYSEYCINLFCEEKSKYCKTHSKSFNNQNLFYLKFHKVLLNAMESEFNFISKYSTNYFEIKKIYILKAIFYFKMRRYFTKKKEIKLANQNMAIDFLKKIVQIKINSKTYLINYFEKSLKEFDITLFPDLIKKEEDYINSLKIEREQLETKLITNSDNDWVRSEDFSDNNSIDVFDSILKTLPTSHFEEKFIKQLNVLYGYDFMYPEKKTSFLEPNLDLNLDNYAEVIERLLKIIESHDRECLKKLFIEVLD